MKIKLTSSSEELDEDRLLLRLSSEILALDFLVLGPGLLGVFFTGSELSSDESDFSDSEALLVSCTSFLWFRYA